MTDPDKYDEKQLLLRIAQGDENSFGVLFERYYDLFYGRAYRISGSHFFCEELVQEVFVTIWKNRQFLGIAVSPDAYLFKIFYRELHIRLKREAIEKKLQQAILDMPMEEGLSKDDMHALQAKIDLVQDALKSFPPQQAMVFKLIKEEGMSREAVARQLGISSNTVRNHLAEAVKRLRHLARKLPFWLGLFHIFLGKH